MDLDKLTDILDELLTYVAFDWEILRKIHSNNKLSKLVGIEFSQAKGLTQEMYQEGEKHFEHSLDVRLDGSFKYTGSRQMLTDNPIRTWDEIEQLTHAEPFPDFVCIDYDTLLQSGQPTDEQIKLLELALDNPATDYRPTIGDYLACSFLSRVNIPLFFDKYYEENKIDVDKICTIKRLQPMIYQLVSPIQAIVKKHPDRYTVYDVEGNVTDTTITDSPKFVIIKYDVASTIVLKSPPDN